jgi:hypothetical protein
MSGATISLSLCGFEHLHIMKKPSLAGYSAEFQSGPEIWFNSREGKVPQQAYLDGYLSALSFVYDLFYLRLRTLTFSSATRWSVRGGCAFSASFS